MGSALAAAVCGILALPIGPHDTPDLLCAYRSDGERFCSSLGSGRLRVVPEATAIIAAHSEDDGGRTFATGAGYTRWLQALVILRRDPQTDPAHINIIRQALASGVRPCEALAEALR